MNKRLTIIIILGIVEVEKIFTMWLAHQEKIKKGSGIGSHHWIEFEKNEFHQRNSCKMIDFILGDIERFTVKN